MRTQLVTRAPDGSQPRWLNQYGHVSGITYSFATPGGCDQLSAKFAKPARWRSDALNPGRIVNAYRGGTCAWAGILDEPAPGDDGWDLTAHGAGSFGDDYLAIWTGTWGTGTWNNAVDAAITRGLNWVRGTDIGALAGLWTGQAADSGSQTITDLLDLGCSKGALTWSVATLPQGNVLTVYPLPSAPNRLLVALSPQARSIGDGPNALYVRYQATADSGKTPATYALTSVTQSADITAHGRREDFMDISSAGVYTPGAAQAVGSLVLQRYTRAAFSDDFPAVRGQLLNTGGQPVDLGLFWQAAVTGAMVCKVLLADFAYGGEVAGGPVTFRAGGYEYDEDAATATIRPFESLNHDFASLMGAAVDAAPVRAQPKKKKKRGK